jgi:hypothetical protein
MTRTTTRTAAKAGPGAALKAGLSVAALAASGALLLTACSSSSPGSSDAASASGTPSGSVPAAASASGSAGKDMEAYRTCLSQHGVNLPTSFARRSPGAPRPSGSPGAGRGYGGGFPGFGGATPDAATQKAMDACKALRPRFNGRGGAGGAGSTAFKAFTSCLKDHGVVLPTPSPGATGSSGSSGASGRPGGGSGFGALRGLDTADPKTAKAYETCRALLPQRPSGAASSSPAATT